jgi:propionyl-CoA synthetase
VPVVDHWWQTETGWAITAGCRGLESSASPAGSAGKPVPGYDVRVLGPDGQEVAAGTVGTIVIRLPLPPGTLPTMWRNDDAYRKHYLDRFPGHYLSGDAGYQDAAGDVWIMSRIDDIINVAGHRLSTGAMEEVLSAHPAVAECAVIGVADPLKGEVPVGLLVLKAGVGRPHAEIVREVIQSVRDRIGPVAAFKQAVVVTRLPKTRSGKILRSTMRRIADGGPCPIPPTIDDPAIPAEIAVALATIGLPRTHASNA